MTPVEKRLRATAVAKHAGISRATLTRWLKDTLIPEPDRDRRGWRVWTQAEADQVRAIAQKITPSPAKAQISLKV